MNPTGLQTPKLLNFSIHYQMSSNQIHPAVSNRLKRNCITNWFILVCFPFISPPRLPGKRLQRQSRKFLPEASLTEVRPINRFFSKVTKDKIHQSNLLLFLIKEYRSPPFFKVMWIWRKVFTPLTLNRIFASVYWT